jgi:nucleoside 2-deoxyribosyltransferase
MNGAAPRVYLAGPDVFLCDASARLLEKQRVCARYGLLGVSPLDPSPDVPIVDGPFAIAAANEAHIRGCVAVLANLTPFRGPSADPGTVYELGYARALGLVLFGYATVAAGLTARTRALLGVAARFDGTAWRDADGMEIEAFGLHDNLMLDAGIAASGGNLVTAEVAAADRWTDLLVFERCVRAAADLLVGMTARQAAAVD